MLEYGVLSRLRGTNANWTPKTGYRKTTDAYRKRSTAKGCMTYWLNQDVHNLYEYRLVERKINDWKDS